MYVNELRKVQVQPAYDRGALSQDKYVNVQETKKGAVEMRGLLGSGAFAE